MAPLEDINGPEAPRPATESFRLNWDDLQVLSSFPSLKVQDDLAFHNPPKAMQKQYVEDLQLGYEEAAHFLNYVVEHLPRGAFPKRILDFGCGWGRMLRLLRHDPRLQGVEMLGVDISRPALDVVRRSVPDVWLLPVETFPPSVLRDESIDLIYAYSVFSHISEPSHLAWAKEFARILRPGGTVCLTTQGLKCLRLCRAYREGREPITHPWHERLAASFTDSDVEERYEKGQFLFSAQGGHGDPEVYGQAVVPPKYFQKRWGKLGFKMVDFTDNEVLSSVVLRYRA